VDSVGIQDSGFIDAGFCQSRRDSQQQQQQLQQQAQQQQPDFSAFPSAHLPSCPDFGAFASQHHSQHHRHHHSQHHSQYHSQHHSHRFSEDSAPSKSTEESRRSWHGEDRLLASGTDQVCHQVPNNCTAF